MEKTKKYILIGLGVVAVGGTAFWLYNRNRNKQANELLETSISDPSDEPLVTLPEQTQTSNQTINTGFPLQKGSKGNLVRELQQSLNDRFDSGLVVDGDFGSKTASALQSNGLPARISPDTFNKIVQSNSGKQTPKSQTPESIANTLKLAIFKNALNHAIKALRQIDTVAEYTVVNNEFKRTPIMGQVVRMTIVTALLRRFRDTGDKRQLSQEFLRIGLKQKAGKWSLDGVGISGQLVTTQTTKVWNDDGQTILVPKGTVLGQFITGGNGITEFETVDHKRLYTATKSIEYTTA